MPIKYNLIVIIVCKLGNKKGLKNKRIKRMDEK